MEETKTTKMETARAAKQFLLVDRPPAEVWAALTEPEQLVQWLAEEADIELEEGGAFTLKSGTPLVSGPHRVAYLLEGESLHCEWVTEGYTTYVAFALEPEGEGTRVSIVHQVTGVPPFRIDHPLGGDCAVLHEMWAYNCGLLKTYLELGEAKCRLMSNRRPAPVIHHALEILAPPERVFQAIIDPAEIPRWNAFIGEAGVVVEPEVGGRYSFGWKTEASGDDGPGEILALEPGRVLRYSWYGDPPTEVGWDVEPLEGSDEETWLTFEHRGFAIDQNMETDYNLGWAGFLQCLALYLERGIEAGWNGYA